MTKSFNPKVSILIPVFNREDFISECIQSALDQDYENIEIIIVDNCSTDRTWDICRQFSDAHSQIKAYRNEDNIGPVENWRLCAEKASGALSKILFSDDLIAKDCVSRMVPYFSQDTVGLVFSDFKIVTSGSDFPKERRAARVEKSPSEEFLPRLFKGHAPMSPGAYMIRTKDILASLTGDIPTSSDHNYSSHGAGPDILMLLKVASQYAELIHIPNTLCLFRSHKGSITVSSQNFEIERAYASVFMHYFQKTRSSRNVVSALAMLWLREVNRTRKWVNVTPFFEMHNVPKNVASIFQFLSFIALHTLSKLAPPTLSKIGDKRGMR